MRNFGLLIKNYIKVFIGSLSSRKNRRTYLSAGLLLIISSIAFVGMFCITAYSTIMQIKETDPEADISIALYALSSVGLIFFVMIIILKGSNMKRTKDYAMLFSLPFSKTTIVSAKIFRDLIFDFISLALVMLPGYVVYGIFSGAKNSWIVVIMGFVLILLLVLLSSAISIILRETLLRITSRFKYSQVIQTIINVFVLVAFLVFYYYFMNKATIADGTTLESMMKFYPLKLIVDFIQLKNLSSILIIMGICIAPFIISIIVSSISFNKDYKEYVNKDKNLSFNENSIVKDLTKKEVSKYFRSTVYVLNTFIGGLMLVMISIVIVIMGKDMLTNIATIYLGTFGDMLVDNFDSLMIVIVTIGSLSVCTTSSSISLEGNQLWIIKSIPLKEKDVFHSKLLLNYYVGLVPAIISSILICVRIGFIYLIPMLAIEILGVTFAALNGLNLNLKYPKLDFKDESEVIKQSMAIIMSLVTTLIPIVLFSSLFFALFMGKSVLITILVIIGILLIIDIVEYRILMTKGIERFRKLNN